MFFKNHKLVVKNWNQLFNIVVHLNISLNDYIVVSILSDYFVVLNNSVNES